MEYEGMVYRPPSEARSLIIQVTIGCRHNACTFCNMYKDKNFRVRPEAEVLADLEELAAQGFGPYFRRVFFADGDALCVPAQSLLRMMDCVRKNFPRVERISAYGTAQDVLRKTDEELTELREAGLGMIYLGAESGDDAILRHIHKGVTADQLAEAGQKLKRNGISTSVTLISGLGGQPGLQTHAMACAELISRMNPEFASFLTLRLYEGTTMYREVLEGKFQRLGPDEIVEEMEIFLRHVDSPGTVFRTNHASNYVVLAGTLNADTPRMLAQLEEVRQRQAYRRFRETGDLL